MHVTNVLKRSFKAGLVAAALTTLAFAGAAEAAPRRTSSSPGRSMSAGCRGNGRPTRASSRNGPTNTASPSTSSRSTTMSRSINQFTAGGFDAVTLTNMDGLSIPAAGGVDHDGAHRRRLLERQRRRHPQGQDRARRHQGPEGQPGRVLGLALPARPRARDGRPRREGPVGGLDLRMPTSSPPGRRPTSPPSSPGTRSSPRSWRRRAPTRCSTARRSPARSST